MRSSMLLATLATLMACLFLVTGTVASTQSEEEDLYARALQGQLDSDALLALERRQIAAGGGSGVLTTYTGVQTISGYNPPPSRPIPTPTPSGGTIIAPSQIPGYGNASLSSGAVSLDSNSHSILTFSTAFAVAMAAGAGWAFM